MKNVNIKYVSTLHMDVLRALAFYEQELAILKHRLEEIAAKNTGAEAEQSIEHFQNELIIHDEKIDELKHALHENLHELETELSDTTNYAEKRMVKQNENLYTEYLVEEKLVNELRAEFLRFAAKWM